METQDIIQMSINVITMIGVIVVFVIQRSQIKASKVAQDELERINKLIDIDRIENYVKLLEKEADARVRNTTVEIQAKFDSMSKAIKDNSKAENKNMEPLKIANRDLRKSLLVLSMLLYEATPEIRDFYMSELSDGAQDHLKKYLKAIDTNYQSQLDGKHIHK